MNTPERLLVSGNEAVALAALDAGTALGTGYPGTPSTEILEYFELHGGNGQWAPNEKVALEVGLGAAYGGGRTLVTMKHVGVNVAADPLFTGAYTGVKAGLVMVSADDPGMHSSQNEQDNRYYARAAGVPTLEPADSQEAYDFVRLGFELSEQFHLPVILRMTTRICHSMTVLNRRPPETEREAPRFARDIRGLVMIPAYARPAHVRLRDRLKDVAAWNEDRARAQLSGEKAELGIVTAGVTYVHAREAAGDAQILKLDMTYPVPLEAIREFAGTVDRLLVVEESEAILANDLRAAGIDVDDKPETYRFGEMSVERAERIIAGDVSAEAPPAKGRPPQLCDSCPHRIVFTALSNMDCIVTGDIGCYTLGVLPPFEAMDTCVCMGASIGVGLGLRHVLPKLQAERVVSVIGDSTFMHSGITGLVEMVYNPPETGHLVIVLDNATTAMTGMQEHPGTGKRLDHEPTNQISITALAESLGIKRVHLMEGADLNVENMEAVIEDCLSSRELGLIVVRRQCMLSDRKIRAYRRAKERVQTS